MECLNGKQLAEIMSKDVYYALPASVISWVGELGLGSSDRLIFERMISLSLQRASRSLNGIGIRVAQSILSEITSVKERTVVYSLNRLSEKGLIEKVNTSNQGTYYRINISTKALAKIKERYKKKVNPVNNSTDEVSSSLSTNQYDSQEGPSDEIELILRRLEAELANVSEKIENLRGQIEKSSKKVSFKEMLKNAQSRTGLPNTNLVNHAHLEELEKLIEVERAIRKKIEGISGKQRAFCKKEGSLNQNTGNIIKKEPERLRYIKSGQIRAISTRLAKIGFKKSQNLQISAQIVFAIQSGWYSQKNWTTLHCVNHAVKLVKENIWTIPAGFKQEKIIGLIEWSVNVRGAKNASIK
ncbi:MAG: hypothetical protein IBX55_01355 [Methyloprofundus sp.]|nr:hypothetical protein [Methyloprofundus sp.]